MTVQQDTTTRITADEFLSGVPGDPYPIGSELVDGVVQVNEPGFWHQELCSRIYQALFLWTRTENGRGRVGWGGNWVLDSGNVFAPDVWWRHEAPTGNRNDGPPDLAVLPREVGDAAGGWVAP